MNHILFAQCLIRLGRFRIGVAESLTLFCLGGGSTVEQVAKATATHPRQAKGRIGALMKKRLAKPYYTPDGLATYKPTESGLKIIRETLKPKADK